MPKILSDRDAAELEAMLRWWRGRTDIRYQRRRRHGQGGGGVGGAGARPRKAYAKTAAGSGNTIVCYLDTDLEAYSSTKTYSAGEWVEDSGTEYKSLLDNNVNNPLSSSDWWEAGTISITVNIEIVGGSDLNSTLPRLEDGTLLTVWNDAGTWRNSGNPFQASGGCS